MEQKTELSQKQQAARRYFRGGYSCAQSVFMAFAPECGLTEKDAARIICSFGGGMGGLREVCGAVSAMFLVLGYAGGYDAPDDMPAKAAHYARVRELAACFTQRHASIICRELLTKAGAQPVPEPSPRTEQYYKARPCEIYVVDAVALLEDRLKNG